MKKAIIFLFLNVGNLVQLSAQSQEAQQLLLNVERLAYLKEILTNLKKGYVIVSTGYNTIKDLSQGNFYLHKSFLDGLLAVSPAVKKYRKVREIITFQVSIVKESKSAYSRFSRNGNFSMNELNYLSKVYSNLFNLSLKNLDALITIITANKLRMSDEDRLKAIDNIYNEMQDKLVFLRDFNDNTAILAIQRARERNDAKSLKNMYGINY
ncbi:hypothetical protein [Segetibacter koreensis]|uniref:hypothetical protein n=1 Tax=Segetibacter koreensis TaxID=398037 RepID=UPI000370F6F2|nr:hypothetical protein [Segetibacter koreensis]